MLKVYQRLMRTCSLASIGVMWVLQLQVEGLQMWKLCSTTHPIGSLVLHLEAFLNLEIGE